MGNIYWVAISIGVAMFLVSMVTQAVLWHRVKINRPLHALGLIFLAVPFLVLCISLWMFGDYWQELVLAGFLHFSLASAYIQSYPAFQEDIPSFRLLMFIDQSSDRGVSKQELIGGMAADHLLTDKIEDLLRDNLVFLESDRLYLSRSGRLLVYILSKYRKIIRVSSGTG